MEMIHGECIEVMSRLLAHESVPDIHGHEFRKGGKVAEIYYFTCQ